MMEAKLTPVMLLTKGDIFMHEKIWYQVASVGQDGTVWVRPYNTCAMAFSYGPDPTPVYLCNGWKDWEIDNG
jgi:hypothetical protein